MNKAIILLYLSISINAFSQVEISASSPNAELEIISQTKGILLPRLNNTAVVNSPQEGLLIYNKASKSPAFHDGAKWSNMMMMSPTSAEDSLTYNLLQGPGSIGEELPLENISEGGSSGESRLTFNITKPKDKNRIVFLRKFVINSNPTVSVNMAPMNPPDTVLNLEINVYHKGAPSPYFTYKFTNWKILAYSTAHSQTPFSESYTIWADTVGYKDWTNNETTAIQGNVLVPYVD